MVFHALLIELPETTAVRIWTFQHEGLHVHLIDTPGFDDTHRSDSDVLKDLAYWLGISYEKRGIRLTGLLYLHPITHTRMAGTPFKNLRTFRKLVGSGSMKSVALVSTMWSASSGAEEEDRDRLLRETPQYWGEMIGEGALPCRHYNTRESALSILEPLMQMKPTTLNLQRELVDEKKDLNWTEAGREVDKEMTLQREALERRIEDTKDEMTQALAAKDEKWIADLAADQEKYQRKIDDTRSAQEEMKLNMERIFAEKEEQYKRSLKEMDDKMQDFEQKRAAREKQYEADKEKARLDKEKADQKAAEQERENDKLRDEAEEANNDKYMAQLAMIMSHIQKQEAGEEARREEYQKALLEAERRKKEEIEAIEKEAQRFNREKAAMMQMQMQHNNAMMMQQFGAQQEQAQYWQAQQQQMANAQAVVGGAAIGGVGAMLAGCCVM